MTAKLGFLASGIFFGIFFGLTVFFTGLTEIPHNEGLGIFSGLITVVALIVFILSGVAWYDER